MSRGFSTVYRVIIVLFSVTALTFSIMSATSCAFVKFDHQYSGRYLQGDVGEIAGNTDGMGAATVEVDGTDAVSPEIAEELEGLVDAGMSPNNELAEELVELNEAAAAAQAQEATVIQTVDGPAVPAGEEIDPILGLTHKPSPPPVQMAPRPAPNYPTITVPSVGTVTAADLAKQAAAGQATATASGDAGLFCDGEHNLSVTNLWSGGSIVDLEAKLSDESSGNTSEMVSKNAALVAVIFGTVGTFILFMESLVGWRMCLERWIVGFIALSACVSQGITFMFFNSERYCDGDIIHEILNQEPCVMGQGAIFSVVSIVLYFIIMVMACCLPTADPYGLCCKKASAKRSAAKQESANTGSKFLGGSETGGEEGNVESGDTETGNDLKPEKPGWLSEEAKVANEKDENELL